MKFADFEGTDREAQPGLIGKCRDCGRAMVAKCGLQRVWHWAHLKSKDCDPWWEQETEWHRSRKDQFPAAWQEIGHTALNGERHRADVKAEIGLVLEFQYSPLSEAERLSREEFYTSLVWVVHGHRRLRDWSKFFTSLSGPLRVASGVSTFTIHRDDSALLRDWGKSRAPVYFEFGETQQDDSLFGDCIRLAAMCWLMCRQLSERSLSRPIERGLISSRCSIKSSLATARLPLIGRSRFQAFSDIQREERDASRRTANVMAKV